jgi:hypothetical protein
MWYYKLLLAVLSHGLFWWGIFTFFGGIIRNAVNPSLKSAPLDKICMYKVAGNLGLFAASAVAKFLSM